MARAFARGGTLIPFGTGPAATDAAHAAVEFMHPVIVGKRALPAIAPSNDPTGATTLARLAGPDDIALAICHGGPTADLPLHRGGARPRPADHRDDGRRAIDAPDHVLRRSRATTRRSSRRPRRPPTTCSGSSSTSSSSSRGCSRTVPGATPPPEAASPAATSQCGEGRRDAGAHGREREDGASSRWRRSGRGHPARRPGPLPRRRRAGEGRASRRTSSIRSRAPTRPTSTRFSPTSAASTLEKAGEVIALRSAIDTGASRAALRSSGSSLDGGARLLAFGNGGSATDAQDLAADALAAAGPRRAQQRRRHGHRGRQRRRHRAGLRPPADRARPPGDIAVAISTSGGSPNVVGRSRRPTAGA